MLTKEQQKIVNHKEGAALVKAGPGTGKTHVLCNRVNHLVTDVDVSADKILLLTFSTAAALNMRTRLKEQFDIDNIKCSTTHAFGLSVVMEYWSELGFKTKPTVKNHGLRRRLANIVKTVAKQNKVEQKTLYQAVYQAVHDGMRHHQIKAESKLSKFVVEAVRRYNNIQMKKSWISFADMLSLSTQLLKDNPAILKKVTASIRHLLVDEVQDFSKKECQLIYYLAKHAESSVLVGDIKQSIYGFRGADLKYVQKLQGSLKPDSYHLTQSFRVPRQMLALVNAIGSDINNDPKLTSLNRGSYPCLFRSENNDVQSDWVVCEIKKLLDKGVNAKDIAILGRTRRSLVLLGNVLIKNSISVVESYGESKGIPVKVLKALMLITKWKSRAPRQGNHRFTPIKALTRVLQYSGLPEELQEELLNGVCDEGWDSMRLPKRSINLSARVSDKHYRPVLALRKAVEAAALVSPEAGTQLLIDALKPILRRVFGKKEMLIIARDFSNIKVMLRHYKAWAELVIKKLPTLYNIAGIELATCHGAKGKEWPYVFLINVVDGEFPCFFNKKDLKVDEELRLLYVAVSRASKKLFIVESPVHRFVYTKKSQKYTSNLEAESRFITRYGSNMKVCN